MKLVKIHEYKYRRNLVIAFKKKWGSVANTKVGLVEWPLRSRKYVDMS